VTVKRLRGGVEHERWIALYGIILAVLLCFWFFFSLLWFILPFSFLPISYTSPMGMKLLGFSLASEGGWV
jgi:hypothetical protein